jgi:succinate dehydrogenase/fumarate reductase cytochrome b subunit
MLHSDLDKVVFLINVVVWCSLVLRDDSVLKYWWRSSCWPSVVILLRITGVFLIHLFYAVVFLDNTLGKFYIYNLCSFLSFLGWGETESTWYVGH